MPILLDWIFFVIRKKSNLKNLDDSNGLVVKLNVSTTYFSQFEHKMA